MDVTLFIAKILGILYTVIGIGILLNMKAYMRMFEDFIEHPAVIYLTGVGLLIGGVAIILNHNVWVLNWPVVITIMGFTATYKGIALIIFPPALLNSSGLAPLFFLLPYFVLSLLTPTIFFL